MRQPSRRAFWPKRGTTQAQAAQRLGFRSGLEKRNADHLEALGQPVFFETFVVPYIIPASRHRYTVDFRLANGILVETKGRWLSEDRAKHLFVRTQYPDLDIRLVFDNPKGKIGPSSSTTVAEWAAKHGFQWAVKVIPPEWCAETGPKVSPEEVLKRGPVGFQDFLKQERRKA